MKTSNVELTIKRMSGVSSEIKKTITTETLSTPTKTRRNAELIFCNEYINRDGGKINFNKVSEAKAYAKLKITSKIIK